MRALKRIFGLILLISILIASLASCEIELEGLIPDFMREEDDSASSYAEIQSTATVSLLDGENYTVLSTNPVRVQRGKKVSFLIRIAKGYEYDSSIPGAVYSNGLLTLPEIYYPTSFSVNVKRKAETIVTPEPEPELKPDPEPELEYDVIELSAPEPEEGHHFICWTLDRPAVEGGTLLSEEKDGIFNVPKGSEPVANYVDNEHYVILYRTNGGLTNEGKDYYYQTFKNTFFYLPNTIHQNGTFKKNNAVLLNYTEKKDGSGDKTTLGGKISTNENGFRELYCQWATATASGLNIVPYKNADGENAAEIVSCESDLRNVVIPEAVIIADEIYTIERIKSLAFSEKNMRSLVLPSTLVEIEPLAFQNCTKLQELTLHDNIFEISDAVFEGCVELKTVNLNAGRLPANATGTNLFARRYEKVRRAYDEGKRKIIVISGSSSMHGLIAEQMEGELEYEYAVINNGTNADADMLFYAEAYLPYLTEGDIIIHAPETTSSQQIGEGKITYRLLRQIETMYESVSSIDMRNHYALFDALKEFNQQVRNTNPGMSYESEGKFINEHTDLTSNGKEPAPSYIPNKTSNPTSLTAITAERAERLNKLYSKVQRKGAEMYLSFAPIDIDGVGNNAMTEASVQSYHSFVDATLNYSRISEISTYFMEHQYFYDSIYHLNTFGAVIRTTNLANDIKAQLIKEGKWPQEE